MFGYIAKYCSKAKKKIELYETLTRNLLLYISHRMPFISFVSYLINKLVSKQDWTAQKVCHHLLNLPLIKGSRIVLDIDYRPSDGCSQSAIINEKGIYETTNIYKKYTAYDVSWTKSSYFYIFIYINIKRIL